MKSSLVIVSSILFLIACTTSIRAANKDECTCGGLGSGTDQCNCAEMVVKAVKEKRPLLYASPQTINDAALARHSAPTYPKLESSSKAADCTSTSLSSSTIISDSSNSKQVTSVTTNRIIGVNNGASESASLETQELLNLRPNAKIVPSFSPIGDLCYPGRGGQGSAGSAGLQGMRESVSKVTPAYLPKMKCCGADLTESDDCAKLLAEARRGSYDRTYGSGSIFFDQVPSSSRQQPLAGLPADPVSLTLAYKNIIAPTMYYKKSKKLVSEDGLWYGPRRTPVEVKNEKKVPDIAEEKLVTVDKPIVELRVTPPNAINIGNLREEEEELAELEAIEEENEQEQEENYERMKSSFLTYGDLGYAPIDTKESRGNFISVKSPEERQLLVGPTYQRSFGAIREEERAPEGSCGPVGPPLAGYVPGRVFTQQEIFQQDEPRDIEEVDVSGSGIVERLRSISRKYGKPACAR